ncbi:MAG TPA: AzlD domain-containing protein [Actinomycetota bacterium]
MSDTWLVVLLVGAATGAIKSVGPVLLGGRALPARLTGVVELLAPALLSALVVTQALASGRTIAPDARLVGLAVAGLALWRRAPVLVVILAAAVATACVRLLG